MRYAMQAQSAQLIFSPRPRSSGDRASASGAEGRRFESCRGHSSKSPSTCTNWSRRAIGSLRPGPRCQPPTVVAVAKREREDSPGLHDLLTVEVEGHRRRDDDVAVVPIDIDVSRIAKSDAITRRAEML